MAIYIIAPIVLGIVVAVFIKIFSRRYPTQGGREKERKELPTQEHIKDSTKEKTLSEMRNNEQSENQGVNETIEILPFKLYHLKTLLITSIVWALISALLAIVVACGYGLSAGFMFWFHVLFGPFFSIIHGIFWIGSVLSILFLIGGLLIKKGFGCLFVIIGVTIWFCLGFLVTGLMF